MFEINNFMVCSERDIRAVKGHGKNTLYSVRVTGVQFFKIGVPIPLITDGECTDLVIPKELHIDATSTAIFFNKVPVTLSQKTAEAYETLYRLSTEGVASPIRHDSQRYRSGMDGAMRLMTGNNRSVEQIRRDHHDDYGFTDNYDDDDFD